MSESRNRLTNRRLTPEVMQAIPGWVDSGASSEDIAKVLGTSVGYLRYACSGEGVSLRPGSDPVIPLLRRYLGFERLQLLRTEAKRRDTTLQGLVGAVLASVVAENLFSAVLGDYDDLDDDGSE